MKQKNPLRKDGAIIQDLTSCLKKLCNGHSALYVTHLQEIKVVVF